MNFAEIKTAPVSRQESSNRHKQLAFSSSVKLILHASNAIPQYLIFYFILQIVDAIIFYAPHKFMHVHVERRSSTGLWSTTWGPDVMIYYDVNDHGAASSSRVVVLVLYYSTHMRVYVCICNLS